MNVQRVILDVGGDAPHAFVRQRAVDVRGELGLYDAALVMAHLRPRVGEERPHFGDRAVDGRLEQFWRVDLGDPQVLQVLLAGEQQRVRHARIVDFQRKEVDVRPGGCGGNDVLALSGADFHDQRIGIAPRFADIGLVEHETLTHVEGPFARVDVQQIRIGVGVPGPLQSRVEPGGPPHEGQHLATVEGRPAISSGRLHMLYILCVFFCFATIGRRVFVMLHTLIYRGNAGTSR